MAQPQCYYHPEKRGTASCPTCNQRICDNCRLRGNTLRCGTCQSNFQKGGEDPSKRPRVQCTNHTGVPTDTKCVTCRKPYCAACLNGANKCFNCALAQPKEEAPKRRKGAPPGKPPARGAGKPRGPARKQEPPWIAIGSGLAVALAIGLVVVLLMKPSKPPAPYKVTGPMKVAIVAPATTGSLRGPQVIKLQVASPGELTHVEITVDGKYWDKIKKPPFQSDWPTSLLKNGNHTIVAKAVYKDKRAVSAKRVVRTRN